MTARYTVTCSAAVIAELEAIWLRYDGTPLGGEMARASDAIDRRMQEPDGFRPNEQGLCTLYVPPIVVHFFIKPDDRQVEIVRYLLHSS